MQYTYTRKATLSANGSERVVTKDRGDTDTSRVLYALKTNSIINYQSGSGWLRARFNDPKEGMHITLEVDGIPADRLPILEEECQRNLREGSYCGNH